MVFSFWAPLWPQKNRAWDWNFQSRMKFSNREWKFQARMKISCVGEGFFVMRSSENEFFRSPRPLGPFPPKSLAIWGSKLHFSAKCRRHDSRPGWRGVKSPKIRGGLKILNFRGTLNLTLFLQRFYRKQFGSQSPSFPRTTFGASPPPLAFGTFWPPPSRSLALHPLLSCSRV